MKIVIILIIIKDAKASIFYMNHYFILRSNTYSESEDKLVTKGTYAKMARGEMVRFIAENNIENPMEIQKFDRLGYSFRSDLSSDSEYVFERKIK